MAIDITENSDFLSALELASDKKAEIRDDHVVLSGTTKDGIKKNIKYKARRKLTNPKRESPRF